MPCGIWTIADVPDTNLGTVVGLMKLDSPQKIETRKQADGNWTVIGTFEPCAAGESQKTKLDFSTVKSGLSIAKLAL